MKRGTVGIGEGVWVAGKRRFNAEARVLNNDGKSFTGTRNRRDRLKVCIAGREGFKYSCAVVHWNTAKGNEEVDTMDRRKTSGRRTRTWNCEFQGMVNRGSRGLSQRRAVAHQSSDRETLGM